MSTEDLVSLVDPAVPCEPQCSWMTKCPGGIQFFLWIQVSLVDNCVRGESRSSRALYCFW